MHPVKFLSRGRGGGLWWPAGLLFIHIMTSRHSAAHAQCRGLFLHFKEYFHTTANSQLIREGH